MTNKPKESRWIPEVQYYDGRIWWEVNKVYSNLVNVEPYKSPRFQQWVLEDLQINSKEKWDKDFCFVKWRKWFKQIEIQSDFDWYEIVDSIELWAEREEFFMFVNYDRTKVKIWKKQWWTIVDISPSVFWFWNHLEFEKWLSEKMTKTYFPWWTTRSLFVWWIWTVVVSPTWVKWYTEDDWYYLTDDIVSNSSWNEFNSWDILPWDYIYLFETWEVWVVSIVENNKIKISWVWKMDISWTSPTKWPYKYMILSERVETFIFQTARWPLQYHNINNSNVQIFPAGSSYWWNIKISWMIVHQDNLYYIDKKSWRLYYWSHWIQQLVVWSNQFTDIWYKYHWLEDYQDYIVMYWEDNIWAAYWVRQEYKQNSTAFNLRRQDLFDHMWAWWEHALKSFPWWLQLIWKDWLLYALWIEATWSATWILKPTLQPQSYHIVDDIARLNHDSDVRLFINWMNISIFINNKRYPINNNDKNTKILIYDYHHKFWYKWMIKWIHINNQTYQWWYYWDWLRENKWDTDNWNDYKQIVSAIFWEWYSLTGKYITMAKFLIWQNCKYTKWQSEIKVRIDNWWRSRCIKYDDIWSSWYVSAVMDRHNWWNIEELPDWTTITNGNWVPWTIVASLNSVFDSYENYESAMETNLYYNYEEDLAKRWKIKLDIAEYADVVYIDIISQWKDNIDFWWFLLWFSQTDTDTERLNDTLWLEN